MAVTITPTPTTPVVSTTDPVVVAGLNSSYKSRLLLDGTSVATNCAGDTTFTAQVTFGATAGTQTLTAQQFIGSNWNTVKTQSVTVVAAGGSTVTFGSDDPDAFRNLVYDTDISTIKLAAGTYHDWQVYMRVNRTSSHPLTVKPDTGAAVVWDGSGLGTGANGLFYFGANTGLPGYPSAVTDYITFSTSGTGGTFTIQNYAIGSTGLIYTGWVDNLTLNNFTVTGCSGVASQNQSHCLYVSSDDYHHASNITANSWNVTGDVARTLNGVQTYHQPNVTTIGLASWTVTKLHRWAYLWADATGITVDGWSGTNCDASIDAIDSPLTGDKAAGNVKNCNGHGSCGTLHLGSGYWLNTSVTDGVGGANTP